MEITQSEVSKDDLALLEQAERYVRPDEFLRAMVALLEGDASTVRVGVIVYEDDDDEAALWFNCEGGNIIIAGPREAVRELHADAIEIIKLAFSETCNCCMCNAQAPSNNTVH